MDQVLKTRIAAHGIKIGMYLEKLQNAGLLLVAALKPDKSLLVVAESQISIHKGGSRNVACLLAPFQFPEKPKCISPSPSVGIRPDKDTDDTRATIMKQIPTFSSTGMASSG